MNEEIEKVLNGESEGCIVCGDSLKIMAALPDGSIPMIWTDPPYGHGNQDGDLQAARVRDGVPGARRRAVKPIANDTGDAWETAMLGFLDEASRVLTPDCCCCCCCCMAGGGPTVLFARVANWIDERLAFFQAIVWDKSARGNGMGWRYRRNYEFVMVAHRKGGKLLWADPSIAVPNIVRDAPVANTLHPTTKPVALVERFLRLHSRPGDIVLDPFCGSGTTCVAAKQLGRKYIGIDIDEGYCDIAKDRLLQLDGKRLGKLHKHPGFFDE